MDLRRTFDRPLLEDPKIKRTTEEVNGLVLVAIMRAAGGVTLPPPGFISKKMREYAPPGDFTLWKLE